MKIVRLAGIVTITITVLIVCVGLFVLLVDLDFSAHVQGRIEPARTLALSFTQAGRLMQCAEPGPVAQGSLVATLDTADERAMLAGVVHTIELLRQEQRLEIALLEAGKTSRAGDIAKRTRELAELRRRLSDEKGKLERIVTDIFAQRRKQKTLENALHGDELALMRMLKSDGLVTRSELSLAEYRAALAGSRMEETNLAIAEEQTRRSLDVERLKNELHDRQTEFDALSLAPADERQVFRVKRQLAEFRERKANLERTIERKRLLAPFAGHIVRVAVEPGEFVNAGQVVLVVADVGAYVFRAETGPSVRANLEEGQPARVAVSAFPYQTYGYVPGTLAHIELVLTQGAPAKYRLTLALEDAPFDLLLGLPGQADIVVFSGTTARYMMERR